MRHTLVNYILLLPVILLIATSCGTQKTQGRLLYDPNEVAMLSNRLGIQLNNLDKEDDRNMPLYAEVSQWIGVSYKYAGLSKKGVDCSGFSCLIYDKVYNKKISRSTSDLATAKMQNVSKKNLKTGDLVFFTTSKDRKRINHVGIYLKDGCFVHASTSQGVIVSSLDEDYYKKTWKRAGRIK